MFDDLIRDKLKEKAEEIKKKYEKLVEKSSKENKGFSKLVLLYESLCKKWEK